jgi:hypothetical protein
VPTTLAGHPFWHSTTRRSASSNRSRVATVSRGRTYVRGATVPATPRRRAPQPLEEEQLARPRSVPWARLSMSRRPHRR